MLFNLKVFNIFITSSGVVADKSNVFALHLVKKESKFSLAFVIFFSNLPAIDVKRLFKWLAMIRSCDIVSLSIFSVSFWDLDLDALRELSLEFLYHTRCFLNLFYWFQNMLWSDLFSKDDLEWLLDFCNF